MEACLAMGSLRRATRWLLKVFFWDFGKVHNDIDRDSGQGASHQREAVLWKEKHVLSAGSFVVRRPVHKEWEEKLEMLQLWMERGWEELQTPQWLPHQQTSKQKLLHLQNGRWSTKYTKTFIIQSGIMGETQWISNTFAMVFGIPEIWFSFLISQANIVRLDSSILMATSRGGDSRDSTKWNLKSKQIFSLISFGQLSSLN